MSLVVTERRSLPRLLNLRLAILAQINPTKHRELLPATLSISYHSLRRLLASDAVNQILQLWLTHPEVEQQQAEPAVDLVHAVIEVETVDEGAEDVVGHAEAETRARRRNGSL